MKKKTEKVLQSGTSISHCNIRVMPESDAATEKRAEAVKALAASIQANAEAISRVADALRGPANETTGIRVEAA